MAHITLKHLRDQIKTSIFIPSPELDLKLLLGSSSLEAENQGQEMKVHARRASTVTAPTLQKDFLVLKYKREQTA